MNYVNLEEAQQLNMMYVNNNNAIVFAVDPVSSVASGGNRNSCVAFMQTRVDGLIGILRRSRHVEQELQ